MAKFKRINFAPGIAYINYGEEVIKIEDQQVFETTDKAKIEFLRKDVVLEELTADELSVQDAEIVEDFDPKKGKK